MSAWVAMRRLYSMGVITTKKSLVQLERLSTAALCRRRLSVVMVRLRMSETLREACTFIEQVLGRLPCSERQRRPHLGSTSSVWLMVHANWPALKALGYLPTAVLTAHLETSCVMI